MFTLIIIERKKSANWIGGTKNKIINRIRSLSLGAFDLAPLITKCRLSKTNLKATTAFFKNQCNLSIFFFSNTNLIRSVIS